MKKILFCTDLIGTLIGKPDAMLSFKKAWEQYKKSNNATLVFNSSLKQNGITKLLADPDIPTPDFVISNIGTMIYDWEKQEVLKEFSGTLAIEWYPEIIDTILLKNKALKQKIVQQKSKTYSRWELKNASQEQLAKIKKQLEKKKVWFRMEYKDQSVLEISPVYANKGTALEWLAKCLKYKNQDIYVAGDSGSDISMFRIENNKCISVENSQPELLRSTVDQQVFRATKPFADGILEGLIHYGIIKEAPKVEQNELQDQSFDKKIIQVIRSFENVGKKQKALIDLAYEKAIIALKKNITPMGFSACSLEKNHFHSTDQNYQSVWARDGAITILGSRFVDDSEIRNCQKNTLSTILENVTSKGLVPANVSIITGEPDYSGVGGIASIDSGLWIIIAFFHYTITANDFDFLRKWYVVLQIMMTRLEALDSNNDGLLEIPEASDWTDLFGRSYNVLYDEALWFYANVCFGRISELVGEADNARLYLRQSEVIKESILKRFWPSVNSDVYSKTFADQQFSMGDTSYLIAQITPFSFDWRCDVYGNILASLFNILDHNQAMTAFRFMWGVGVNHPWPVVNLYPTVNAGDPSWRSYYTVNLLNLPHHYHNGGIWPFIGAEWVRFINRLGLKDIAQKELYRLAELNKQGITDEWEFNEWMHGKTGRPMGKAYQAWSAAGFIKAYYDVNYRY